MVSYKLSNEAEKQLDAIYEYSILKHGLQKARIYLSGFAESFESIVENPMIGWDYGFVKKGYRRFEYENHSIYYTFGNNTIVIQKILHKKQDPTINL